MELTQANLERFIGGDIEIQNPGENYLYRGPISTARLSGTGDDAQLVIETEWLAKMSDDGWNSTPNRAYAISMLIYTVSDIGDGRICLTSGIIGETTVLFPPGGSKLDPTTVRGLVLA